MTAFPALPGLYNLLFLHIEPVSTISPAFLGWFYPGAAWFYSELIPPLVGGASSESETGALDARASMAIWQLTNCYLLLGLISSLVFRAVRDALPHDPVAQERIVGASLTALALADVTHMIVTLVGLPPDIRYNPLVWNPMTHGNISFVVVLLSARLAWFMGIGRKTYYYGKPSSKKD
ncbi:hypothetical protein EW145_g2036 [Phellinidium pouzarii]|uniref:DUF7704 domain-containing protein n=1 Tax=Phellinidium pouzarii TaxID=167371 RepID=A0A4S4LCC1_9AGAM|nr:hypothetical protein EW145_g2036 [Phellinidium pouzarii]